MEQSCFLKVEDGFFREKEIHLGERFQGEPPWNIRAMNQRKNEEIWKKSGNDLQKYQVGILVESIISPRLTDVALQKTYGVYGAGNLLMQMLLPGEFQMLQDEVEKLNGKRR